jgi:YVTN family beta-propeller protein
MKREVPRWRVLRWEWLMVLASIIVMLDPVALLAQSKSKKVPKGAALSQGPRQSSPIGLTADDTKLVNVNPDAGSISIFDVSTDSPTKLAEILVGQDPESLAVHPLGTKVYVANARDGTVGVVDLSTYKLSNTISVGSEPMAVALSPNATQLYVACSEPLPGPSP